jgi:hypothetical protein
MQAGAGLPPSFPLLLCGAADAGSLPATVCFIDCDHSPRRWSLALPRPKATLDRNDVKKSTENYF